MYVKLFASLYQGTLRGKSDGILVFTNLLAHADQSGRVDIHPRAIAEEVGLSEDSVRVALGFLEAVDEESRSPENEGRRIVLLDGHRAWGWQIVNYGKYRAIKNEDDRREQNRLAQERWRSKQAPVSDVSSNKQASEDISSVSRGKPMQKQKQIQKKENTERTASASRLPDDFAPDFQFAVDNGIQNPSEEAARFRDYWIAQPGTKGRKLDWQATWRNWCRNAKPANRPAAETPYQRSKRELFEAATGRKPAIDITPPITLEMQ
jgi:hypothetical protein